MRQDAEACLVACGRLSRRRSSCVAGVTVREYPALNHPLMAGEGPSRPAEYAVPRHVAADVVADLAAWVGASAR